MQKLKNGKANSSFEMKGSKYKNLASNTIIFAIGNLLVKLIAFFLMPLYTSMLTTSEYGIAVLLNNSIELVLPVASFCIIEALYRFSIDKDADHNTLLANSLFIIIIGDAIVCAFSFIWYYVFGYEYALHFVILYITTSFYRMTIQFARGLGHVKKYVLYGVINSLILVGVNIISLVVLNGGIKAYLLSLSISHGVAGVAAFIISREYQFLKSSRLNIPVLKEMLKYSLPSIPNMLSWWVNNLSDRYIVLFFWGTDITGLYTAASQLPAMVNMLTTIFQRAWQYSAATEISSEESSKFFSNIFRVYTYVCVGVCSLLIISNKIVCKIVLQADFYPAWQFVPILLYAATLGCISTFYGTFYNALKNNKMLMISSLTGALCNIIMNFILIPKCGGTGAAIATAISYLIIMIIRMADIRNRIDITVNYRRFFLQYVLLLAAMIFACTSGLCSFLVPMGCFVLILFTDQNIIKKGIVYFTKDRPE